MAPKRRSLSRTLRYLYHRLFPRHERSSSVALSVALGVFIGVLPTLGIALLLTALVAQVLRIPKGPGLAASFIAIPPTLFFFFYPLGYFAVGLPLVRPPTLSFDFLDEFKKLTLMNVTEVSSRLWNDAQDHVIAFLLGMLIVASVSGLIAFALTYTVMEKKQRARIERRRAKHA